MKAIKPMKVGLLSRNYEFRRRFYFCVDVLLYVPLGDETSLLGEIPMWKFLAEELGKTPLDEIMPKQNAEFLVSGRACPPREETPDRCLVRARVGDLDKTLYVFGDRNWERRKFTGPEPFTEMPLAWEHTYGGEKFKRNPIGKGHRPVAVDGVKVHALPNIEYPGQLVTSPKKDAEPAGFMPIDLTWPQRFKKVGTYKKKWLAEDYPGVASDIDWTFFNVAPEDQQRQEPFRSGEAYSFENMNPRESLVSGHFPNLVGCCFLTLDTNEGEVFRQVETKLTTAWFFPHAKRGVLIWQGVVEVTEEDASDVVHLMVAAEEIGKPKGLDHYREVLRARLDKESGHIASMREKDLLPDCIEPADPNLAEEMKVLAGEGLMAKRQRVRAARMIDEQRQVVADQGLDPDEHGPAIPPPEEPPPSLEELPDKLAEMEEMAAREKAEAELLEAEQMEAIKANFEKHGLDFELFLAEKEFRPQGPPPVSAEAARLNLAELARRAMEQGMPNLEIEQMVADPERLRSGLEGEASMMDLYRRGAHTTDPSFALPEDKSEYLRDMVKRAFADGRSLAGYDLTGADLSRLELRGVDFEDAFLESVKLDSADLTGAKLDGAVLAHASLRHSRLDRASLKGTNLGGADLTGAMLPDVDMTGGILMKANLTGASLRRANINDTILMQAQFREADLSEVEGFQLSFMDSDLRGVVVAGARLKDCLFMGAEMGGVDFSRAFLEGCTFMNPKAVGARFKGAWLKGAIFTGDCRLDGADFRDAYLVEANLRGVICPGGDFSRARLDRADLSEANLAGARFYRSVARETRFMKCDLTDAVMTSANLKQAVLAHARLYGTDLRGANLFGGDFARVYEDERTRKDGALTKKLREVPKWEDRK